MMARAKKQSLVADEKLARALVPESEWPYELPENWAWIRLVYSFDNLTSSQRKVKARDYLETGNFAVVDQGKELVGGFTDKEDLLFTGELPVVVFGDHTRAIKYVDFPFAQGADGIKVLRPKAFFQPKCFYYMMQIIDIPDLGYRRHFSLFQDFACPLPPLAEQQRIVDRIESLFARLDQAKELIQSALDSFETRKAAILHKAFTGELTAKWRKEHAVELESWGKKRFDEVADIKSNLVDPKDYLDFPHIAPDNIEKRTGVLLDYRTIREDGVTSGKHRFYAGQILYSKIRPYLSKVIAVDFDGLCSADVYPIHAKGDNRYLWYYMLSDEFLEQASSAGSRSVLPKINQKELSALRVITCSFTEQQEIVRILDDLLGKEQEAKNKLDPVIDQIDLMKKSILARAFRGELGTNDPSEKSAVELLKSVL